MSDLCLEVMNISRLMKNARQVEGEKLRKLDKDNMNDITRKGENTQHMVGGGKRSQFQQNSLAAKPS